MLNQPQDKLVFDFYDSWFGPYRPVKISPLRDILKRELEPYRIIISNDAHAMEHSIEGMIPFLQYYNRNIDITPIMITAMDFDTMDKLAGETADIIAAYIKKKNLQLGKDIFFLISADANHYGMDFNNTPFGQDENAHATAISLDQKLARNHLDGNITREKIKKLLERLCGENFKGFNDTLWCGRYSIPFGLLTVMQITEKLEKKPLKGKILGYSDTYSSGVLPVKKPGFGITAPFSPKHWVGFFAAGFYF
jgi:AmmeMemoRadiSam system protein B